MPKTIKDTQPRVYFDCDKCPAFCCSIYERVAVTDRDIRRLARHFGVSFETARRRYTTRWQTERVLRKVDDKLFDQTCVFLDQDRRGCSVYHARPGVCREYPDRPRCVYYDVLQFERKQQGDDTVLPVFQITFREPEPEEAAEEDGETEAVWEWEPEKKRGPRKAAR